MKLQRNLFEWLTRRNALVHAPIPSFVSLNGRLHVEVRDCSCCFCCDVISPPLSHDSVLKALHTDKGILTSEECSECASKRQDWYSIAAIVIATKTKDDVQRALDVARQQFPTEGYYLEEFARLLQSKPILRSLAWPARFLPFPFRRQKTVWGLSPEKLCRMSGFRPTAKN